uniref:Uncharacterized protein n=1 Tax=Salmo trutta TaxID=8032 RepID=A0A674DWR0_SALTR
MSAVVAQCHYSFGLRTGVANNRCYFDKQTVIFPSGNNCVRYFRFLGYLYLLYYLYF